MSCSCRNFAFDVVKEFKSVVNSFVFNPPKKYFYTLDDIYSLESIYKNKAKEYEKVNFHHDNYSFIDKCYTWITESAYIIYNNKEKEKVPSKSGSIVLLYLSNTSNMHNKNKYTLLYSHGNSASLGSIYSFLYDLSTQLKCDVVSYDYSGYGLSEGVPSEEGLISNIATVYKFMREKLRIKTEKIIAMGNSIGSYPSVHLASHKPHLSGLILVNPLASGKKLVNKNVLEFDRGDIFNNARKIKKVRCPILIIHGKKNKEIPVEHSVILSNKAKGKVMVWFPSNATHKNIYEKYRCKFLHKIKKLFDYSSENMSKDNQNKIHKNSSCKSLGSSSGMDELSNESKSSFNFGFETKNKLLPFLISDQKDDDFEERKNNKGNNDCLDNYLNSEFQL